VLATLSRWRPRVRIPSGPLTEASPSGEDPVLELGQAPDGQQAAYLHADDKAEDDSDYENREHTVHGT
jgi:hypothetical protein